MSLPKSFKIYLKINNFSPTTCRNYLSDLNHFLGWLELKIRGLNLPFPKEEKEIINFYFNRKFISEYKNFLLLNSLPLSTINRRLSTLRTFGDFCLAQNLIKENPAREIGNLKTKKGTISGKDKEEGIIEEFKEFLRSRKNTTNTIKNYISDIKEFLRFLKMVV